MRRSLVGVAVALFVLAGAAWGYALTADTSATTSNRNLGETWAFAAAAAGAAVLALAALVWGIQTLSRRRG